jgi:peptide/nickel transport system substrate-binding protein
LSGGGSQLTPLIYEGLITLGIGNELNPMLADSWKMSSDGKEWTFQLREGIQFHDGTNFDSKDVKFTAEWGLEHGLKVWWRGLNKIEIIDKHAVKFIFDIPRFTFDSELALTENFIMSSTTPLNEKGVVQEAIGTGPFKLYSWSIEQVKLLRNDGFYWNEKPKLEKIISVAIPDTETRAMALEAGKVDAIWTRGMFTAIPRLKTNPTLKMHRELSVSTGVIYIGTNREPFDDLQVRKAINHIINREEIVTYLLDGYAVEAKHMFSPAFGEFVNKDARNLEYNPEQAKQLLRDAGFEDQDNDNILERNGESFRITLTYDVTLEDHRLIAKYLQHEFQKFGIKISLNPVERALMREMKGTSEFDLLLSSQWFIPHNEPANHYRQYFHSTDGRFRFLNDSEIDTLINQLDATGNRAKRLELHHELQKEILERAPVIHLYNHYTIMFTKDTVNNFEASVHSRKIWYSLKNVYIEAK